MRDSVDRSPHTRGGGPHPRQVAYRHPGFSPHAWGWTGWHARAGPQLYRSPHTRGGGPYTISSALYICCVLPTRVGVDRVGPDLGPPSGRSPHTRGGGPKRQIPRAGGKTFSPHAWGWTVPQRCRRATRAGSPHTRGGGPRYKTGTNCNASFSPHAWGWTAVLAELTTDQKVLPTRVGVDRTVRPYPHRRDSSPHTRGGGPDVVKLEPIQPPFSPHAWGWTADLDARAGLHGVLPTRVGVDRRPSARARCLRTFSPHAWGWTAPLT